MRVFERLRHDERDEVPIGPGRRFDWVSFAIWVALSFLVLAALRAGHFIKPLLGLCVLAFAVSVQSRQLSGLLLVVSGYLLHG